MDKKFNVGDTVRCLAFGRNNSDMIAGEKYVVSEVDASGMIKLESHPDWWSSKRFEKIESSTQIIN